MEGGADGGNENRNLLVAAGIALLGLLAVGYAMSGSRKAEEPAFVAPRADTAPCVARKFCPCRGGDHKCAYKETPKPCELATKEQSGDSKQ